MYPKRPGGRRLKDAPGAPFWDTEQQGHTVDFQTCKVWVLATQAEDVPGEWVAHCLSLDLVSQGRSLDDALEAIREAIVMVVADDLENGLDPLDRPKAPVECWNQLGQVMRLGRPLEEISDRSKIRALVAQIEIVRPHHPAIDRAIDAAPGMLPVWQYAALQQLRGHSCSHA